MPTLDEIIAASLRDSAASGELQASPHWGKPLPLEDGFEQTPQELRMAYKVMKDAGLVPPEIELMRQMQPLREALAATTDGSEARALRQRLSEMQQQLALRLEHLSATGSL